MYTRRFEKAAKCRRNVEKGLKHSISQLSARGEGRAHLTVQASAVVAHLASDATLFRHRSVQLFARLVKDLGRFCSIIFARRVVPGVLSTLVLLHLGCVLQSRLKSHHRSKRTIFNETCTRVYRFSKLKISFNT